MPKARPLNSGMVRASRVSRACAAIDTVRLTGGAPSSRNVTVAVVGVACALPSSRKVSK
jgi:hypothetical protein